MTAMVRAWGAAENVPQLVAHLPWGHIFTILDKAATGEERDWYAAAAVQYGWSRNVLLNMMMNRSVERTGTATSNFTRQLATPDLPSMRPRTPTISSSLACPVRSPNAT